MFGALRWVAGTPLAISVTDGTLVIGTDRVLLAAYPERELLLAHPPAALDMLLADHHATLLGGDRS